jgi:predicted DNA-binding WGR domain protein
MRQFRRFELHKGNKEVFWEVSRHDKEIITRWGKLKKKPGEKDPHPKREDKKDFRVAQLEYDKLIQRKLSQGYNEVNGPSLPSEDLEMNAVQLVSLDGQHSLSLAEAQVHSLINYMIDLELFNKRVELLDISKWERRTLRTSPYSKFDEIDPLSEDYIRYFDQWKIRSKRDRSTYEEEEIPAYKFTDRNYWIVTAEECRRIHRAVQNKLDKKTEKSNNDSKPSRTFLLRQEWSKFHKASIAGGGYEVKPADIRMHSLKGGKYFFTDLRGWNEIYKSLTNLKIWDKSKPAYKKHKSGELSEFIIANTLKELGLDTELLPLDDGIKHDLESQLLIVSDQINEHHRSILLKKNPEADVEEVELIDYGFKWNVTNLKRMISTLNSMEDNCFAEELFDYFEEQLSSLAEESEEGENLDKDTQNIINDILNDACHLINYSHQNICNTTEHLIDIEESVSTDVFAIEKLPQIIACIEDLYPNIADVKIGEDQALEDVYEFRPSGLDAELMEDWLHLLPESIVCLELLQNKFVFEQTIQEIKNEFPSAKHLLSSYLQEEVLYLEFQSQINRKRKKLLAANSEKPGKILLYKLNNLDEPWEFMSKEVSLLITALEKDKKSYQPLVDFLNEAEDNGGFNIFVSQ